MKVNISGGFLIFRKNEPKNPSPEIGSKEYVGSPKVHFLEFFGSDFGQWSQI